uniref:Mediator of RNA polymerase II transcription subunit 19 n=1 Tax=Eptatretus burgeri TaxID=7764 RepID=A0A8C4WWU3_EPTBU
MAEALRPEIRTPTTLAGQTSQGGQQSGPTGQACPQTVQAGQTPGQCGQEASSGLPFYLVREPASPELSGSTNLISHYNLDGAYSKFCGKKVKEKLSHFLPDLPGMIDNPASHDGSGLRLLLEKPPVVTKEFHPLTGSMLTGFRLHAGPLPEQYRALHQLPPRKKNKHRHKHNRTTDTLTQEGKEITSDSDHKKKKKKKDDDPERKKRKKEKKKKKVRGDS